MASSGTRPPRPQPVSRRCGPVLSLAVLILVGGCIPTSKIGSPPRTGQLEGLTAGVSTREQVIQALGPPRGQGMVHTGSVTEPRHILYYSYAESSAGRTDQSLLLVFLLADRYDGYLWFVSGQILKPEVTP